MKTKLVNAVIVSASLFQCYVCHAQEGSDENPTYLLNAVDSQTKKHISGLTISISAGNDTIKVVELAEPYLGTFNYATRLKPGKYKITIKKPGFNPITNELTISVFGLAETKTLRFTRGNAQPPAGEKPPGPAVPGKTMYQLQVIDSGTSRKLDGATVSISGQGRKVTAVDRTTHYAVPLTPGRYTITVSKAGFATKSLSINLDRNPNNWQSVSITLVRARNVPNPVNQTATYLLSAVDGRTRKLMSGLTVTLSSRTGNVKAQELAEPYLGAFNYSARLKPGKYKFTYSKAGYDSMTGELTIGPKGLTETKVLRLTQTKKPQPPGPEVLRKTMYQLQVIDSATKRKLDGATVTISGQGRKVTAVDRTTHYAVPLGPGRYTITVSKAGFTTKSLSINLDRNPNNWQSVSITLVRAKNVPNPVNQTATYFLSAVDGRTRKLMSGLTVTLSSRTGNVKAQELAEPYLGAFNYSARLKPGKYKVTYSKPGFDPETGELTIGPKGLTETKVLRLTQTKKPQPPAGKNSTLWIKVIDDGNGGAVLNPTVVVSIGKTQQKVSRSKEWHYLQLQSGRYDVSVSKTGYVSQNFSVAMGTKKEEIRTIRLKREQPTLPKGVVFRLRVLDDLDSKPLSGATVSIKAPGALGTTVKAKEQKGQRILYNYTTELAPGKYSVTISKIGYASHTLVANVIREGIREVIKPIRLKRVQTPPSLVTLWFKVVDDQNGQTIPGAVVEVTSGGAKQKVVATKDLYYSQLKPGGYTAIVAKSGYTSERVVGKLGLETAVRTVRLKRSKVPTTPPSSYLLQVEVVNQLGASIRNPNVVITATGIKITPLQKNGLHTSPLKPGRYSVAVSQRGYKSQKIEVVINRSDLKRRITLIQIGSPTPTPDSPKGSRSLTVVVVDSKGKEIDGANVSVITPAISAKFRESAGTYKASGLKTGLYTVNVSKSGYDMKEVKVSIGLSDGRRTVILTRTSPSEFVLRVIARDENGKPIVSFQSKADPGIVVELVQQITYTARLKPGSYEVRVVKTGYEPQTHAVTIRSSDRELDLQLKPIKKTTDTPDPKTNRVDSKPSGLALQPGKSRQSKVSPLSPGGLLLKRGKSRNGSTVTPTSPGGLGLTAPKDNNNTKTTDTDSPTDSGTLTISRRTFSAR